MEILNLFPIPLGKFILDRPLTTFELDFVMNQAQFKENRTNFFTTDNYILKNSALQSLNNFFKKSLDEYFQSIINPKNEVHLEITQSWINITKKGQSHHQHKHWNSLYSGVFYINAVEGEDRIFFHNYQGLRDILVTPNEWNIYNSMTWWVPVKTGELLIFPSSLFHEVDLVQHEHARISLSFNTFPIGWLGNREGSTELIIPGLGH
jgi:uncharacterized protein (TIGR02466 family)